MLGFIWLLIALASPVLAGEVTYELKGQVLPEGRARVTIHRSDQPFTESLVSDPKGRFTFHKVPPGEYSIIVNRRRMGIASKTVVISRSAADEKRRIAAIIEYNDDARNAVEAVMQRATVSMADLARESLVSDAARAEYLAAQQRLAKNDVGGAVERLERAVKISPGFTMAWNNLGTIAYQTRSYSDAERYFREALKYTPEAFEPLVNLGGVLLNLGRPKEALEYNQAALRKRPHDPLANAQLGLSYFMLGDLDRSRTHLETTKKLDPAHFSHPQLTLADIHLRRREPNAAADEIAEFLRYHPDWPDAAKLHAEVDQLRGVAQSAAAVQH